MLDFPGDVCERCRRPLHDSACPSCGWTPEPADGERPPYQPDDDVPPLDDYRR